MCKHLFPWLLPGLLLVAGCQAYERRPLDWDAHRAGWAARDPGAAEVVAYARRLESLAPPEGLRYDPADGLSLPEAEVVALFFNAELRAARLKAKVPLAGAAHADRWEDPELSVDAERILRGVEDPWVLGGMLNVTLPLSGRLGAERDLARAQADVEALRARVAEHRVLAELRTAWAEWSAAGERVALTEAYLKDLDEVVLRAERLRQAGELDRLDERLFRIERATRSGELRALRAERRQREAALRRLMGLTPDAAVRLLPAVTPPAALASTVPATSPVSIAAHPRLRLAEAEHEVAERTLAAEVRKQYPDLTIGGGPGTEEGEARALLGLSLPLPLWNANRRAIAEARASRDASRAEAQATFEELLADLAQARDALEAARERRAFLERELAPLVDEQVAEARRLGRLGDFNTLVLVEALRAAHEAKLQVLDAVLAEATARFDVLSLSRPAPLPPPDLPEPHDPEEQP